VSCRSGSLLESTLCLYNENIVYIAGAYLFISKVIINFYGLKVVILLMNFGLRCGLKFKNNFFSSTFFF